MGNRLDHTLRLNPTKLKYAEARRVTQLHWVLSLFLLPQFPSGFKMNRLEGGKGKG